MDITEKTIIASVIFILAIGQVTIFNYLHLGYTDTGTEKCLICYDGHNEYKCDCEKDYKQDFTSPYFYLQFIWIFVFIILFGVKNDNKII